jgi:hypothetical protein
MAPTRENAQRLREQQILDALLAAQIQDTRRASRDGLVPTAYDPTERVDTRAPNRFGDVGSLYGNESLRAAGGLLSGDVDLYDALPAAMRGGIMEPVNRAVMGAADIGVGGLLGLLGLGEKGVGYGAELIAGGTEAERRLARDILGGADVAGISPQIRALGALSAPAYSSALMAATRRPGVGGVGEAAAAVYNIGDRLAAPSAYRSIPGKPSEVAIPGAGRFEARPVNPIEQAAREYMERRGMDTTPLSSYPAQDPQRARLIASAYDMMQHDPANPAVRRAYDAMIQETMDQYNMLRGSGIDFRFLREGMEDPYARSPSLGYQDLVENGRLWVFPTDFGFGSNAAFDAGTNPLLTRVGRVGDKPDAVANDAFRAVHDAFGHFGPGNPFFRAPGEERAWLEHSRMYSHDARGAMTSETRGQNSWLNFGPFAEQNRTALGADTVFADQKTGLLDQWAWEPEGMPSEAQLDVLRRNMAGWGR